MKHDPQLNAKAARIRSGEEFKKWLMEQPEEYRESIKSHRAMVINLVKSSRLK